MKHRKICSYANLSPNFSLTFTFFSASSSSFSTLSLLLLWFCCCCVAGNFFCGLCFFAAFAWHCLPVLVALLLLLFAFSCCRFIRPHARSNCVLPINRRNTLSQGYELLVNVTRRVPTLPTLPNFWLTGPSGGECFLCFLFYLHLLLPLSVSLSLPTQLLRCLNCRLVNDVACSCSLFVFSSFSFACLIWHNFHFLWQRPEVATGWQQQQSEGEGAQDTARKLLSRQHFGCHSLGFCAAAWWHSMPQTDFFFPATSLFFRLHFVF